MSEYHIKATNKTPTSNYSLHSSHQNAYAGKYKTLSLRMTSLQMSYILFRGHLDTIHKTPNTQNVMYKNVFDT